MRIARKDVALALISTIVAILAAEGLAQLFFKPAPRYMTGFRLNASGYYMPDDSTGWLPRPNVTATHNQDGSFESTFTTNSRGLRDDESAIGPRQRPTRLVALGDSFTWGFGVNDNEIYTAVIEEIDPSVEVVNLGVTAFGLQQDIVYFDKVGRSMNPDIVLLALVMNDITDPLRKRSGETVEDWMDRIKVWPSGDGDTASAAPADREPRTISGIKPWLADNSVLYRALTDIVNTNKLLVNLLVSLGIKGEPAGLEGLDSNLRPFLVTYPESVEESVLQTKRELLELRDKVRAIDAKLLVVVVPALQSVDRNARLNSIAYTRYYDEDFDIDRPYEWLAEFGEEEGIAVLNPVDAIRESHNSGTAAYLPGDMHFNTIGHRLFAEEIVSFLRSQNWID